MENNQEIPLPKGYTQVSKEESVPLPKGYTEVLDETTPDVKKKEQTKPTQTVQTQQKAPTRNAPLPGLGGVSEEPLQSPSVGQGVLRDVDQTQPRGEAFISRASDLTRQPSQTEPTRVSGAGGTFVTKEDAAPIIGYEENQKALSDIDKQISNNQQQGRFIDPTRQKRLKELQAERDILKKRSDQLISETNKDVSGIISKGIGDDWEDFTNELGDIDVSKIGDFARQEALNYGLPEDGYFFERVKNAAKAKVELEKISPTTESFFLGGERRSPEGIVRKKDVQLPGYDSPSTVLMSSYGPHTVDGKYAAFPTLFPKDPKRQTSDPNDWIVTENDDEAYRIAKERGEVLYFDTQKEADAMAEGSWKKIKGTYEEMYGVKPGDDAENMLSREDTRKALGLSKLDAEFSEQMAQLNRDISRSSTQEIEAVSQDRYGMPIDEYVSQLGQGYERSVNEVESRYSSLIQDGKFVGSQDQYDAYQQDLQSVRSGYGSQFNDVVSQNMRDVAAVNNKANRRFNRQRDEILQAYKTEYTDKAKGINPILQERYQKAYNKALDKAMEVENVKKESRAMLRGKLATGSFMGGIGASGIISGASGQMSSIFRSMGMKEGAEFFEQAAVNFDIGDTEIKGWKDILDPKKLIKSTSFTLGGMAPMLAASTGVGMVTGGVGGGAMLTTLAAGTAGFGVETMSITQDAYDQKFKETGSVAKAEEAANKSFNGQVMLMPMYALGMAPFFGNIGGKLAKIGMNNAPARFIAGGVMETVSELGQEYPQQLFEQAIADDKELSAAFDYASVEGFKSTVLNVAPTTFLLGGGGAATQKGETSKEDMAKALAMKVNIGELTETAMEQKMLSMTVNAGEKFSKAFVATQLMEGNITEEQAERATSAIESSVATIEKGKEYNLDNKNNYILATLYLKLKAAKAKAESESDPMMKGIAENKVKKIEKQAQQLMEIGNVDVALVTYPDGSFDILTHDEARLAMSKDEFMESFSSGDLKVEAMGESQAKLMSELQEKAKAMEPEAASVEEKTTPRVFETPTDEKYAVVNEGKGEGDRVLTKTEYDEYVAPVEEVDAAVDERQKIEEKERGFFGKILDKVFKDKKIEEDVQITEEQKEQGIQEIYDKKVKRIEDNIKEYQETGDTILENLYREELEILKSESPRQYLERDLEFLKGMPNYYSEKASKKDDVSYNKQLVQGSVDKIYQIEKLLGITATEQEVKERQDIIDSTPTRTELEAQQNTVPVAETPVEEPVSAPTEVAEEAAPVELKEGEIDITTVFKNPVEKNNEQAVAASNEFKDKAGEYDEGVNDPKFKEENTTVEEISVDDIIPTQERLFEKNLKSPSEGEPLVMKIGDKYYVEDGHHRIGNEINADKQTVSVRIYESDKAKQDAVQKQAAGKVPVQPEAKAGEKVEEGKPKTETEKPTQEGKEVSEEEKVKAAKDNLNSVWEKWKQSQNNLGIAFDPKSKANEDMELLEAFLTYIKALGIKTAKDIQKAFNDFTGGEATLDDVGAEFIANKVNPKKGETNYEKTEDMNRKDLSKRGKSLFNAAKKLFMDFRRTFVKFSSDTRELLKSTTDIRPVYDYFVARLGSPGNANLIFQEAKKKIYDGIFPNLRKHLDSLIKYRRIITINESRVESNRKGLGSLKASEIFEKAGDEAVNAFNEAVSVANDYANSTEQQALDARGIRNEALKSLRQSEWYKSLSELKQKRFEKQLREDLGFLKNENFTGKDSNGNPIGLSVAKEMLSEIEVVVGEKDFNKINERAELYFDEFKKMLEKDLKKGIISQEQYDAMIGNDYSPRVFIQHMFGFDGEFIENIDEARLMKEYSLSSDAIRTLREGLKDLNTNEAYWELITDSEKLLAGYISSRERRYAFNDLNTKMVSVLSKFEAEFNELKKKEKFTKEERLRYKKLGNILDAFSTERKRGMSSANYYENGEKKSFYIRDDIFKQWYDMRSTVRPDGTATKLLDNLFQIPQRILQSFATGEAAPFFFVFNTARDFVQLSVISDVYGNWTFTPISMAKAMKDFAKGAYHIFMDDALYREAMENGVGMDFLYMEKGLGLRKMMKDSLLKLAEKSDITRVGSMALTRGVDAMSSGLTAANRYSELGFRIAIYERVRDAEYKKIEAAKDKMTDEEYLEAKQDARKKAAAVSRDFMNFSEGGSFTKKVNPYASYLNAAVIGTDTVVKEFRKNPLAFTFRVAQGTTILSTAMLGMGLMMLNMFDEDDEEEGDDKDKQYGTLKKYYKILDSVSPYYRNKFYIIPTGRKDENGNYEVIRIAKNPALIPISYAAEKALRYNLEKQLLGSEERYSSENLEKDALEINYLFHEYLMPINLSPVDKNGKVQDTGVILSSLVQKNIPLSLMMIAMTGYDPYTNRYISPEKKYQSELDSKYLIGWNDPEIQGFYKDMAMELNTSITPKEMKVMVEKVITRPENNPIIASVYSMLDRNNKTSDIIKKDRSLVSDILNMTKKVAVISADYEEYAKKPKTKKIEEKIREHKEEKYVISKITKTVLNDIIEKVKDGKIDALDADGVIDEMNKMVSTQIDVFKEADVEVSEKDENEIRHKIYRNAVPVLKLPQLPTQYKLAYVVDKDPVVMAYRFFEDFGDVDVNDRQFIEISAQMMNEYTAQYNSKMSKDKFSEFLNKYIEAKNDPELIGN